MNEVDLWYLSAVELRERFASRELSPVEVTRATLERIERLNPDLNAFITVTAERALDDARRAERDYAGSGDAPRPLSGIPISIKDITPTKGIRTTRGSLLSRDWVPDEDAPYVERVSNAGAVLLGKTNTPELGWKGDSGNRIIGPTHNPWKHGRTAGGSSGGAAAAVAAGLGPLSQGTDGAGSIRIPAGFCGVFGFKPSFGLVPYYPASTVEALAHVGPITRTVRDAALLMDITAGPDPRDRHTFPTPGGFLGGCEGGISGLRIAWSPDLGFAAIDPEVLEITTRAANRLQELGARVEEAQMALPDPWPIVDVLWASAQAGAHKDNLNEVRDLLDPGRLPIIERGSRLTAVDLYTAYAGRNEYYQAVRRFMEDGRYDLLVTPALPITAFEAGADQPGTVNGTPTDYLSWTAFTYPFNVTGQPAAAIPCGFASDGLPVALQIVGRWHDDLTVLRASAAFEDAFPWSHPRPPVG